MSEREHERDKDFHERMSGGISEQEIDISGAEKQILVAGVGNAWMADDGFGGEVVKRLIDGGVPSGVKVLDFGTGGLDLAYEVMRGYHALVLVDISPQGGEAGTLYVMEPDPDEIAGGIEDGEVINPHGMDPQTVLRFVKAVGGWPGKVVIVACEPEAVEEMGLELSDKVEAAVDGAVKLVLETVAELQHRRRLRGQRLADALRPCGGGNLRKEVFCDGAYKAFGELTAADAAQMGTELSEAAGPGGSDDARHARSPRVEGA